MESKRLDNAALAAGISPNYINAHGKPQSISAETKRRLLDAMHQRTATKVAVTPVPNVMVYTSGKKMPMVVEGSGEYSWLLTTEEGTQYKGHVTGGKAFNLPTKLPEGYHTLTLTQDDQRAHCRVIVAPKRCYEPQALLNKQKLWGACVQLYTAAVPLFAPSLLNSINPGDDAETSTLFSKCFLKKGRSSETRSGSVMISTLGTFCQIFFRISESIEYGRSSAAQYALA